MEFRTDTLNTHDIQSTGKVTNMKLDEESQAMIFQMFTGGLYSDAIGTLIREIASNCFDSHIEAGVDSAKNPVIVEMKKEVSGHFISFVDKGVGMSPDRIENIYGTYFKSTKRTTNDQIGGFGLGGKTPLAYTESFYIITRFDGIEYTYNVFEGNNVPAIELMNQESTTKPNGTEVKVPIKGYDVMEFEQKTLRQLYYFENIIFKGFTDRYVSNDYTIIKGENFLYRGDEYSSSMHVCYGKVAYPLDYDAMGLEQYEYDIPVAIKIEIGELEGTGVTPSREAIKYSKENVKIIKQKIELVLNELKEMLGKQYDNVRTMEDYYKVTSNFGHLYLDDSRSVYLGRLVKKSDITYPNFKYKELSMPEEDELIGKFFNIKLYGKKYSKSRYYGSRGWNEHMSTMSNFDNIYYTKGKFERKVVKQGYLKTLTSTENFYVVTPIDLTSKGEVAEGYRTSLLRSFGALQEILNDDSTSDEIKYKTIVPRKKAEKMILSIQKDILKSIIAKSQGDYNEVEVPEDFILARKKNRLSPDLLKTTIPVKDINNYGSRERLSLKQLNSLKGRIYYGFQDDEYQLRDARDIFDNLSDRENKASIWYLRNGSYGKNKDNGGTLFIGISKGNEKYMKMLGKKAFHVSDFYKTFVTRKIDKIIESRVIKKYKDQMDDNVLEMFGRGEMKHIDEETYNLTREVKTYISSIKSNYGWYINDNRLKNQLGVDLAEIKDDFKYKDEINQLVLLSKMNENRMKWFNFPYHLDLDQPDHKELIEMVSLMFEK